MPFETPPVWAAGAVLLRGPAEALEVALVHRPRYDDWSLPKGKANPTELLALTAVREVAEETGALIRLGPELSPLRYFIAGGRKIVSYWRGVPIAFSQRAADDEVDEVVWLPLPRAYETMTWADERRVVAEAAVLPETTPLLLVRHAQAVRRKDWAGPDGQRPVDERGLVQISYLDQVLQAYGVAQLYSSPAKRCLQTVADHALRDGLAITEEPLLSETGAQGREGAVAARIARLAQTVGASGVPTAVCSHRPVLALLAAGLGQPVRPLATAACLIAHIDRSGKAVAAEWQDTVRGKSR
ncbi:MAG: NUDIX hydrolase [Propionibacteriaceae bacterium]|jgi:8-oxo-dGTP diphosphatase|nr:NUDIX hydrolase [Propionibacteriaceae bacterium]